jgi:hypothetical protein
MRFYPTYSRRNWVQAQAHYTAAALLFAFAFCLRRVDQVMSYNGVITSLCDFFDRGKARRKQYMTSERVKWIQYKGKRIMHADFSNFKDEAVYLKAIEEMEAEVLQQPKGKKILTLIDFTDSIATTVITERSKQMTTATRAAGIPDSPTALVGVSGYKKAIVQAMQFFRPDIHLSDSIEAAKDWLIEQADKDK